MELQSWFNEELEIRKNKGKANIISYRQDTSRYFPMATIEYYLVNKEIDKIIYFELVLVDKDTNDIYMVDYTYKISKVCVLWLLKSHKTQTFFN